MQCRIDLLHLSAAMKTQDQVDEPNQILVSLSPLLINFLNSILPIPKTFWLVRLCLCDIGLACLIDSTIDRQHGRCYRIIYSRVDFLFQSTYCSNMVRHCEDIHRVVHVVNLDPAAEYFDYPVMAGL